MGKIAFVEILDRRGNVRERVKVNSFPATIGRGYSNDVIIDDRMAGVEHLRLGMDSEGGITVEDLNTANGTQFFKSKARLERHTVPPGGEAVLRIGQTILRLRGDDFAVGPVTPSRTLFESFGRSLENGWIAFLVFIAGFGFNVLAFAQEIDKKVIWSDLTGMSLVLLIVFALWTGFWSFLCRLVAHSFRFMTHLGISAVASVAFLMFSAANQYFEFLYSAPAAAKAIRFSGIGVILALLIYSHLSIVSELSRRKRALSSALISAGVIGIALLISYTVWKDFSNELRFSSVIKPIGRSWVRTVSTDQFFGDLHQLREKIDAMAREDSVKNRAKE